MLGRRMGVVCASIHGVSAGVGFSSTSHIYIDLVLLLTFLGVVGGW